MSEREKIGREGIGSRRYLERCDVCFWQILLQNLRADLLKNVQDVLNHVMPEGVSREWPAMTFVIVVLSSIAAGSFGCDLAMSPFGRFCCKSRLPPMGGRPFR